MNAQQKLAEALFDAHELGLKTGQLRERRIILDYLADHIPAAPGGAQWVDNVVAFIASRTEQPAGTGAEGTGTLSAGPASEPAGERCGMWFIENGERAQCYEPVGHDGAHASSEQMETWRQIREQAKWYPQSDGSALWARYLDGDR